MFNFVIMSKSGIASFSGPVPQSLTLSLTQKQKINKIKMVAQNLCVGLFNERWS